MFVLLAAACAANNDQPVYSPRSRPQASPRATEAALQMLQPADWWHQPMLAAAVKLTADQMSSLDKIATDQGEDPARLEHDRPARSGVRCSGELD